MASTVTIAPSSGNPVLATDGGVWDIDNGGAGGYGIDLRRMIQGSACPQEGVLAAADWKVTATNSNLTVTVAANTAIAVVQGDDLTAQGRYTVAPHSAAITLDLATSPHATLPRLDMVVLQVDDDAMDGSGQNRAQAKVISGTATGGATLDNRTGAATIPDSCLLLADLLVPAAATQLTSSDARDRRRWAQGAYRLIKRTANAAAGSDYSTSSTSAVNIDATNLAPRLEITSGLVRVKLIVGVRCSVDNTVAGFNVLLDAAAWTEVNGSFFTVDNASWGDYRHLVFEGAVSAASHTFTPTYRAPASGTLTVDAQSSAPLVMVVEEITRANAGN